MPTLTPLDPLRQAAEGRTSGTARLACIAVRSGSICASRSLLARSSNFQREVPAPLGDVLRHSGVHGCSDLQGLVMADAEGIIELPVLGRLLGRHTP